MYKIMQTRKHGIDIWIVLCDRTYITCFMSEWMASQRANQLQVQKGKK